MEEKVELQAASDRISSALDRLEQALSRIEAQYETLNTKVDRIVAAVEEDKPAEMKAESERQERKTVSPTIVKLLAKSGVEPSAMEESAVDQALAGLSVEQRIAVKAELARAGVLQ